MEDIMLVLGKPGLKNREDSKLKKVFRERFLDHEKSMAKNVKDRSYQYKSSLMESCQLKLSGKKEACG